MEVLLLANFLCSMMYIVNSGCLNRPQICSKCTEDESCSAATEIYRQIFGNWTASSTLDYCTSIKHHSQYFSLTIKPKFKRKRSRTFELAFRVNSCTESPFSFDAVPSFFTSLKEAGFNLTDSPPWKEWPQCLQRELACEVYNVDRYNTLYFQLSCIRPCEGWGTLRKDKDKFLQRFLKFLNRKDHGLARPTIDRTGNAATTSEDMPQTTALFRINTTPLLKASATTFPTTESKAVTSTKQEQDTSSFSTTTPQIGLNHQRITTRTESPEPEINTTGAATTTEKETSARTTVPTKATPGTQDAVTTKSDPARHEASARSRTTPFTRHTVTTKSASPKQRDEKDDDESGFPWWIVAVAIVVAMLVLAAAIFGFVFWKKRKFSSDADATQKNVSVKTAAPFAPDAQNKANEKKVDEPEALHQAKHAIGAKTANVAAAGVKKRRKKRKTVDKLVDVDPEEKDHSMQTDEGLLDKILREMREKEIEQEQQSNKSVADRTQRP